VSETYPSICFGTSLALFVSDTETDFKKWRTAMTIIRHNRPDADVFDKRFSEILDDLFKDAVTTRQNGFTPRTDIVETETGFEIEVQLPGIKKEDINVNIENNVLSISGERKFDDKQEGRKYHRVESRFGAFNRSVQLPDIVDPESVKAGYKDGILSISINKSEKKISKQIKIS
jgi:HSP20 family protein